jgi:hypothetical protein
MKMRMKFNELLLRLEGLDASRSRVCFETEPNQLSISRQKEENGQVKRDKQQEAKLLAA